MTYDEALRWHLYMKKRGGTNLGLRFEAGFALLAVAINRSVGGKAKFDDFAPHLRDEDSGLMDIFAKLGGKKSG
jgi:hypothetical protein